MAQLILFFSSTLTICTIMARRAWPGWRRKPNDITELAARAFAAVGLGGQGGRCAESALGAGDEADARAARAIVTYGKGVEHSA